MKIRMIQKKMQRIIGIVFIAIVLASCSQVYFAEPQPVKAKAMSSFPKSMQGVYSSNVMSVELKANIIYIDGIAFKMTKESPQANEVQVRFSNNLYFANFSDSAYFSVFMVNFYDDKMAIYMLDPDQRSVSVFRRFIPVDTVVYQSKKSYLIKPVKKEFETLVDNEVFDVVGVLTKQ